VATEFDSERGVGSLAAGEQEMCRGIGLDGGATGKLLLANMIFSPPAGGNRSANPFTWVVLGDKGLADRVLNVL
jgi:hypothetical protein